MKCNQAQDKIPAYMEGDLPADEAGSMRDHLQSCAECRRELESYQSTWEALDVWEDIEPSGDFTEKFSRKAFKPGIMEVLSRLLVFRVPAWAMALLVLFSFLAGYMPGMTRDSGVVPDDSRIVYVTATEVSLTEDMPVPGQLTALLPAPGEVLSSMENSRPRDIFSDWDEDYTLERVDPITLFNNGGSS